MNAVKDHPNDSCDTNALNSLLRCELSAVETYEQAITKFEDQHALADLEEIREDHAHAVVRLRERVSHFGGQQVESPGPWPAYTASAGTPSLSLAALRQGEQHTINEYEMALQNEAVNPECKNMIRGDLLPHDKVHVEKLDRLMGGMD
jgi:hypothetical protein